MQMRLINVNAQVNNQSYTNAASFAPPITSTRAKSAGGGGAAFGGGKCLSSLNEIIFLFILNSK